ncbi:MAG: MFS transporter [Gammaproteobacteria bacterium]|nr:MFS transporter [Gammaproteobacteria bacterium]
MQRTSSKLAMVFLAATACINSMGMGLIVPVMPALLVEISGGDLADAAFWGGIALVSYAIMQFIFSPIMGALSDRFGRRPILLMSLTAYAADMLLLALVQTLPWFLLIRGLAGVFASTFSTTSAYVADITPPDQRARRFAIIGAAFGAGFILGPAIGGVLGDLNVRYPFFAGAVLAASNAIFGAFFVGESLLPERRRAFSWARANTFGTLLRLVKVPGIGTLLPVFFLATLSSWVYPTVWSYVAKEKFLWTEAEIGWSIAYYGVIAFLAQAVVAQLILPRMHMRTVIWLALLVEVLALLGIGLAGAGWFVYLMVTTALISTMQDPAIRQAVSARVPDDAQGELQGGLSALTSVAMIMAPLIYNGTFSLTAGEDALFYLPGSPFIVAAAISGMAVVLYAFRSPRQRQ